MALTPSLINKNYQKITNTQGYSGYSGGNFGFDPRSIPGCILWVDAQNSNNVTTSGTDVTLWSDLSINDFGDLVGTAGVTYSNNYLNFSGAERLYASLPTLGNLSTYDFAFFAVVTVPTNTTTPQYIVSKYSLTTLQWSLYFAYTGSVWNVVFSYNATSSSTKTVTSQAVTSGDKIVISVIAPRLMTTGTNIYINGVASSSGITGISTTLSMLTSRLYIGEIYKGSSLGSSGYLTSSIGEILMYNSNITSTSTTTVISDIQRQQIEGYLAFKWGITITGLYNSFKPFLRPFRPPDIANCLLWLDGADDSSVYTATYSGVTSPYARWNDKSGNNQDGIASLSSDGSTCASQYQYYNTGIPATTGMYFPWSTSGNNVLFSSQKTDVSTLGIIRCSGVTLGPLTGTKTTMFIVFSPIFPSSGAGSDVQILCGHTPIQKTSSGYLNDRIDLYHNHLSGGTTANGIIVAQRNDLSIGGGTTQSYKPYNMYSSNMYMVSLTINSLNGSFHVNNSTNLNYTHHNSANNYQLTLAGAANYDTSTQGGRGYCYQTYSGYIHEVIVYQGIDDGTTIQNVLSNSQIQQVEGYLAWKWGLPDPNLTNISTSEPLISLTHPFTKFPSATVGPYPTPGT